MEPTVGIAAVLPLHIWAGIEGALIMATIWFYQNELRAAGMWVWRYRKNQKEDIARRAAEIADEKRIKRLNRIAEATALQYVDPEKRGQMAEKLREKWRKEHEAERHPDKGRSQ